MQNLNKKLGQLRPGQNLLPDGEVDTVLPVEAPVLLRGVARPQYDEPSEAACLEPRDEVRGPGEGAQLSVAQYLQGT